MIRPLVVQVLGASHKNGNYADQPNYLHSLIEQRGARQRRDEVPELGAAACSIIFVFELVDC